MIGNEEPTDYASPNKIPVKGYEGAYSVTKDGRVWSEKREIVAKNSVKRVVGGSWLTPFDLGDGYLRVNLRANGQIKMFCVHWVLARSFIDGHFEGMEIDHIDRNNRNNNLANLRYVTKLKNVLNREAKGCYFRPSRNRWQAILRVGGKSVYTGLFKTEQEAHEAYWNAKNKLINQIV